MPNGVAISKRRFRLRLPPKNDFERFRNFRVRFRNGAPAQDFLKHRIRNISGSISKWRSRPGLPQKERSAPLLFEFERGLPPKTSSKTEFETFRVRRLRNGAPAEDSSKLKFETVRGRFRNSAPAQDLFQNRIRPFRAPISKCPT